MSRSIFVDEAALFLSSKTDAEFVNIQNGSFSFCFGSFLLIDIYVHLHVDYICVAVVGNLETSLTLADIFDKVNFTFDYVLTH